ncbi:putative aminoglycoside phosphotransferase [Mycobacteroides abscessus subsp. massiliense]|nr:putative aminoglycoside phosphotransferase [Mycobacteroides abscessus subsp. massiliense]
MSDLTEGLTRYLRDEFGKDFTVSGVVGVSAGARRRNVLLDATFGSETLELVATIVGVRTRGRHVGADA